MTLSLITVSSVSTEHMNLSAHILTQEYNEYGSPRPHKSCICNSITNLPACNLIKHIPDQTIKSIHAKPSTKDPCPYIIALTPTLSLGVA